MENNVVHDYLTEKVWDALIAGCIPVYMGTSLALQMVPDRAGVIVYDPDGTGDASNLQELHDLLYRISRSRWAYRSYFAWKYRKVCTIPSNMIPCVFKYAWGVQWNWSPTGLTTGLVGFVVIPAGSLVNLAAC